MNCKHSNSCKCNYRDFFGIHHCTSEKEKKSCNKQQPLTFETQIANRIFCVPSPVLNSKKTRNLGKPNNCKGLRGSIASQICFSISRTSISKDFSTENFGCVRRVLSVAINVLFLRDEGHYLPTKKILKNSEKVLETRVSRR